MAKFKINECRKCRFIGSSRYVITMNPDPKNDERLPITFKTAIVNERVVNAIVASIYQPLYVEEG